MASVKLLSRQEIRQLLDLKDLLPVMREVFLALARGEDRAFPVVRERLDDERGIFGIKSGYLATRRLVGYKSGGFWAGNVEAGLANHQSVIVLHAAANGLPLAVLDGNLITTLRTGAANAVALQHLARPNAAILSVIGAGDQGRVQARAALLVLPALEHVFCYDPDPARRAAFARELEPELAGRARLWLVADEEQAVRTPFGPADVIVTATPSWDAHLRDAWVAPGTHISAIGADTRGKQELDVALVMRSKLCCDCWEQARELGESQHAAELGKEPHAQLGDIINGQKAGRESAGEVTVFDATGIALQDLAAAALALARADERGLGHRVEL